MQKLSLYKNNDEDENIQDSTDDINGVDEVKNMLEDNNYENE